MSSTNRGAERQPNDHYDTPTYTTQSLLGVHDIQYPIFEPCAGNLAISNLLDGGEVHTLDIDSTSHAEHISDYLTYNNVPHVNTIITNPPFNRALEIIEKALVDVADGGEVIMLLRLNFLGAQKRKSFWDFAPLKYIYVLSKRPCFINGKSDSTEYAWFVFERGYESDAVIEVI